MNTGAFGENFPYSNFHDLNTDWIIKIAKDFLDQYTHIQETIDTGLEDLDTKANTLEALLQEWYDTHSEDIANKLADALNSIQTTLVNAVNSFNQQATQKATETLATIPDDYNKLFIYLTSSLKSLGLEPIAWTGTNKYIPTNLDVIDITDVRASGVGYNYYLGECSEGDTFTINATGGAAPKAFAFCDADGNNLYASATDAVLTNAIVTAPKGSAHVIIQDNSGKVSFKGSANVYAVKTDNARTENIEIASPKNLNRIIFENKAVTVSGTSYSYSDSPNRLATKPFMVNQNTEIHVPDEYEFRLIQLSGFDYVTNVGEWGSTPKTFSDFESLSRYILQIKRKNNKNLDPSEITIPYTIDFSEYDLSKPSMIGQNMIWSWWTRPILTHRKQRRNQLYIGYTNNQKISGVACFVLNSKQFLKHDLWNVQEVDDHNAPAVLVRESGRVIVAGCTGHDSTNTIKVSRGLTEESIEYMSEPVTLTSTIITGGEVSYVQLFEYHYTLYMFYRIIGDGLNHYWVCRTSSSGEEWSEERIILSADIQYYILFTKTDSPNMLRMVMTGNPDSTDTNIRIGYLDLDTFVTYNRNGTTVVTNSVYTNYDVVIQMPSGNAWQRLLDARPSGIPNYSVLYTVFSSGTDAEYYVNQNGNTTHIGADNYDLLEHRYQNGACFIDSNHVAFVSTPVLSDGTYCTYIAIRNITTNELQILYKEYFNASTPYTRLARPVSTEDGKYIAVENGEYNRGSYSAFNMDAKIIEL